MGYNFKTLFAVCVIAGLSIHGTGAQPSAFVHNEATGATVVVDFVSGTAAVPTTISLAEDFGTGTITTISVTGSVGSGKWKSSAPAVAIGEDSGAVTVAALDYETSNPLTATLTFTEATTDYTVALTLTVTNAAPVFLPTTYAQAVTNGAGATTSITTVTATDVNGPTPTYEIIAGNTGAVFEVNDAGLVQIATGQKVDAATLNAYALLIVAKDAATGVNQMSATAAVAIGVCSNDAIAVASSVGAILLMAVITIMS